MQNGQKLEGVNYLGGAQSSVSAGLSSLVLFRKIQSI